MKLKTKVEILETIKKYEKLEFYQVDLKELPDLKDLKIVGDDIDEKIINFLRQGYNPYYVRKGGVLIKVSTISNGKSKTFQRICYELLEEIKD